MVVLTDVSEYPFGSNFQGQTLEDGTNRPPGNVCKKLTFYAVENHKIVQISCAQSNVCGYVSVKR